MLYQVPQSLLDMASATPKVTGAQQSFVFLSLGIIVLTQLLHTQLQTALVRAEGEETNRTMSSAKVRVQMGLYTEQTPQCSRSYVDVHAKHDCTCWSVLVEANTHWVHLPFHAEIIYMAYIAVLQGQKTFKPNIPAVPCTSTMGWLNCELAIYNFKQHIQKTQGITLPL